MKFILFLMAAFVGTSKATVAVDSSLDVVSDAHQGIPLSDTKKAGLVSAVAAVIAAAAPNLRGAGSFSDAGNEGTMDHDKGEHISEEVQEDISTTGGLGWNYYTVELYNYFPNEDDTGTPCRVTAGIKFNNGEGSASTKYGIVEGTLFSQYTAFDNISADSKIGDFKYVELEIGGSNALLVDMVRLDASYHQTGDISWGGKNSWGWCLSTDPYDNDSWNVAMGGLCYKRLRFAKNGHVYDPDGACDASFPVGAPTNDCCTITGNCKFCWSLSAFIVCSVSCHKSN